MSIARQSTWRASLRVQRTFTGEGIGDDNTITVGESSDEVLDAGSTPACTLDVCLTLALSSGTATLNMASMTDPTLGTVDATNLTPRHVVFINPSTNANNITIAKGGSNGYTGFGSDFSITIPPGGEYWIKESALSAVLSGSRTLDLTGTLSQALTIQMAFG